MAFKPLNQVFDARLKLPINEHITYYIPEPDAELGLFCQGLVVGAVTIANGEVPEAGLPELHMDDAREEAFSRRVLGPVHDQMIADGLGHATRKMVLDTAFFWIVFGIEIAEAYWNGGGDPKALSPGGNRASRRAAAKPSTGTAGVSTAKQPASGNGTKSRPTKRAPSPGAASRSRGN